MTDEEAKKILRIAANHAASYRRNNTLEGGLPPDVAEKCATAASNTAWFALSEFGYSPEKIRQLYEEMASEGGLIKWRD